MLKMTEKRQVNALSKYKGTQVIESYMEDKHSLRNRLQWMKKSFRKLEDSYRTQTAELQAAQKQHKRLLDLTKNKKLDEKEKLSDQLEEAENTLKLQENENQVKRLYYAHNCIHE